MKPSMKLHHIAWLMLLLFVCSIPQPGWVAYAAQVQQATAPGIEYWRAGYTVEGVADSRGISGRILNPVASFRSFRGINHIYFYLASPARVTWVKEASFFLLDRTGSFTGTPQMTLEIWSLAGILQHQVSVDGYDISTLPTGSWYSVSLQSDQSQRQVEPGEYLAFHTNFVPNASGDLAVHAIFDVKVSSYRYIYMPVVIK